MTRTPIRRALLSVWDKTGLPELARALHEAGAELVSTGNTATAIEAAGLPVTRVEDLADSELSDYVLRAQGSPALAPLERVKFFKLVWDAVGSEFASRHTQYEMFYAGAGFVTKAHSFRTYDWDRSTALVDRLLDGYNLTGEINGR